jgi:hypothetical protein
MVILGLQDFGFCRRAKQAFVEVASPSAGGAVNRTAGTSPRCTPTA